MDKKKKNIWFYAAIIVAILIMLLILFLGYNIYILNNSNSAQSQGKGNYFTTNPNNNAPHSAVIPLPGGAKVAIR